MPGANVFDASCKCTSPLLKNVFLPFSMLAFLVHGFYLLLHAIQADLTLTRFGKTLFAISDMYLLFQWVFKYFSLCINAVHCLKMPASALICRLWGEVLECLWDIVCRVSEAFNTGADWKPIKCLDFDPHPPMLNPTTVFTYCQRWPGKCHTSQFCRGWLFHLFLGKW